MADIDSRAFRAWLDAALPALGGVRAIDKFAGGQSNPTYRIAGRDASCVLRRKPFGKLLPSAHAIEREYRLLAALHPTGFPVPRPLALCDDAAVVGSDFYLMSLVEGRNFADGRLPGLAPADRRQIYREMIATLAQLHAIDVHAVGLGDFGRPGHYAERQVSRWIRQYRAAETETLPDVERLIDWLPRTLPEQRRTAIIHGDYRIDNLVFATDDAEVAAVLDWELATIGDPLADFAYLLMNWIVPPMGGIGIADAGLAASGIPSLDEALALYAAATGESEIADLHWYFAFNLFRLTGIVQGIRKRIADGNAASPAASEIAARAPVFARLGWEQALLAGA